MAIEKPDKLELIRLAMAELGEVSAAELAAFIEERFAVKIEPRYVPVIKASLRDREHLEKARQARKAAAEKEAAPGEQATHSDHGGAVAPE